MKFYTVDEVEELLHVSESTVLRWLHSGELEGFKAGERSWRISEEAIQNFVQRKTEEAKAKKAKKEAKHHHGDTV